jgi:hypothetical protein
MHLLASPHAAKLAGVGTYRREQSNRELDMPWRAGQTQKRPSSQTLQARSLHEGRHPALARLPSDGTSVVRSMRSLGSRLQHPLHPSHVSRPQARVSKWRMIIDLLRELNN